MTSTYLSYRLYANDFTKSLQRIAAEPQNANDQKYYEANIGKVKSVDDFLNNYRLFTYAMKAYGLGDLGNAKALMKQVLESNLSDANSVANRLDDSRYQAFAKAFNFTTTGTVATTGQVQTNAQQLDTLSKLNPATSDVAALESQLSSLTSVSSFEASGSLYSKVLAAYGLPINTTLKSDVTFALESDLSNPYSFANRPGNEEFRALAEDFNFGSDGKVGVQKLLQSAQSTTATETAYMSKIASDTTSQDAAKTETAYYSQKIPELTSVNQLIADPRLVAYVKTAFGLDAALATSQLRDVLTSNLLDPKSVANTFDVDPKTPSTSPTPYQLAANAFSIGADGTAWDHSAAQSVSRTAATTTAYTSAVAASAAKLNTAASAAAITAGQTETDYFVSRISSVTSVDTLLADSRLVSYLRTAFNLPAPTTPATANTYAITDLGKILRSNVLDSASAANTLGANARKLATSFNFAPNGLAYSQRPIQNAANMSTATSAYMSLANATATGKAAAQAETDYFTSTMPYVKSVDDLISNTRLVAYLSKAYNIPATQTAVLKQVLTSNLLDPKSVANKLGGAYQTLAAAFDISTDGTITHEPDRQVQTKTGIAAIHSAYLDQIMETEAGDQNGDGVRLALYFKRVAPTITSAYGILADKAMTAVVQTMLGLSSSSSNADIDSQARFISSKINFADFKDPQKLDKLVSRFAALYDLKNNTTTNPTLALFGG